MSGHLQNYHQLVYNYQIRKIYKYLLIYFFLGCNKNNWQNSVESNKSTKGKIGSVSSIF